MKFETLMLRGLVMACLTVCGLIFGALLTTTPTTEQPAQGNPISVLLLAAPSSCALPADGVMCAQPNLALPLRG